MKFNTILLLKFLTLHGLSDTTMISTASADNNTSLPTTAAYSYDPNSSIGPDFWKDLVLLNNQCGGGSNSPIALDSVPCTTYANYTFKTGTCTYKDYGFVINDHVEQANAPPTNSTQCEPASMEIPGVDGVFELLQFHVHMNSEHTLDGNHYGAELHMVHKQKDGDRLAVVGVFIQANDYVNNDLFTTALAEFDATNAATRAACNLTTSAPWWSQSRASASLQDAVNASVTQGSSTLEIYELIPEGSTFYHYDGGLTTPPCTEIVDWNVADIPLSLSIAQFNDLSNLIFNYLNPDTCQPASIASPSGSTSRPVQDLNNRTVDRICPMGYVDTRASTSGADGDSSSSTSGAAVGARRLGRGAAGLVASTVAAAAAAAVAITM